MEDIATGPILVEPNFTALNMFPAPDRTYVTPYTFNFNFDDVVPTTAKGKDDSFNRNPANWVGSGSDGFYGPTPPMFRVRQSDLGLSAVDQAKRLVAAAELLVGLPYQHHHSPSFSPSPTDTWGPNIDLVQTPGVDCSDFTGFIYNYALGIELDTGTNNQSLQTLTTQRYRDDQGKDGFRNLPISINAKPTGATDLLAYQTLVSQLKPGDLIFISGTGPGSPPNESAGHVVMWLGNLVSSSDGMPLIVDCTGSSHIDQNNINTPGGIHIRPFAQQGVNSWYWTNMVRWSRVIPNQDTPLTTLPYVGPLAGVSSADTPLTAALSTAIAVPYDGNPNKEVDFGKAPKPLQSITITWGDNTTTAVSPASTTASAPTGFVFQDQTHSYAATGTYTITVTVTDGLGNINRGTTTFMAVSPPAPTPTPTPTPPGPTPIVPDGANPFAVGAGIGGVPVIAVFGQNGQGRGIVIPFPASFRGGVRVATGDVNGDGVADLIAGAGPGGAPQVTIIDGRTLQPLTSFYAFPATFSGGVYVAAGDVNGDGRADVIVGAGEGGGPQVNVYSGADGRLVRAFYAFDPRFTGGVRVAAGDLDADRKAEVVCGAGPGGRPEVAAFHMEQFYRIARFTPYPVGFTGGVTVAVADVTGDGRPDVLTGAGSGGGPQVNVIGGVAGTDTDLNGDGIGDFLSAADQRGYSVPEASFYAFPLAFSGGVRVGAQYLGSGRPPALLAEAGPGGGPEVLSFDGRTQAAVGAFFAFPSFFSGGVFVS